MKKRIKLLSLALTLVLAMALFAGCGSKDDEPSGSNNVTPTKAAGAGDTKDNATAAPTATPTPLPPLKLSIMLPYGTNEHDEEELTKRFYNDIETYTNTDLEFTFYASDMYYEKLALTLASGDVPSVLVTGKTAEFMNAVENDAFWDISDYVYDYQNLGQLSETVFQNASINGRLYGMPRSRDLGRNGFGYRLDWLNNLGLKEPETIDELYDMLVGFTYDDPDGNGKDDTVGLGVTSYAGTWDIMQVWFGAPNQWGIDANENLIPAHMTDEYDNALAWFRKVYSEGLVNQDFNVVAGGDWDTLLLRNSYAGSTADVVDRFRRNQEYFEKEGIPAETNIIGYVDAGYGPLTFPTAGFADLIAISKQKVTTEDDMKRTLQFLDDLMDAEMQNLVTFGYENESFKFDENGYAVHMTAEEMQAVNFPIYNFKDGMNQLLPYFQHPDETANTLTTAPPTSEIRLMEAAVKVDNGNYAVPNFGASYTSDTYTEVKSTLDPIMSDARIAYIMGEIDDVGLQEAKDQWLRTGGQTVIDEMNAMYKAN